MIKGITDVPIQNNKYDYFNIDTYVKGLSTFIQHCETPMTISIQGDWGSGKTSMMYLLEKDMQNKAIHSIWFNTWQFSQFDLGNSLIFSMLELLISNLDNGDSQDKEKALKFLGKAAKAALVGGLTFFSGGLVNGKETVDTATSYISQTNYAQEIAELKQTFAELVKKKLKREGKNKLVIFVDDLDRLRPGKAVELLEVLKLFLDCEQCVFVLAVDYEVVTLGVREKYGDGVSEEKGKSFFDKIIQLPFKMPVSNYDITNFVAKTLESMGLEVDKESVRSFVGLIGASIGFNPRAMKRLFNTYQLLDTITKPQVENIKNDVRERILFGLICMQMSYENLYRYIAAHISDVDNDMMERLKDESAVREDEEFMLMLNKSNVDIDVRVKKIANFMACFYSVVDFVKKDNNLDEEELATLRDIFKFTKITSVYDVDEELHSPKEKDQRDKAKKFVDLVNAKILEQQTIDNLRPSYTKPRKGTDNYKDNYKEVSSRWPFKIKGYSYELRYYVTATEDDFAELKIELQNKNGKKHRPEMEKIFELADFNVRDIDGFKGTDEYGTYQYSYPQINMAQPESINKVAELYIAAYDAVQNILKKYEP